MSASGCSRKRKLETDCDESNADSSTQKLDAMPPAKKAKLSNEPSSDLQPPTKTAIDTSTNEQPAPFDVVAGGPSILDLFASNTLNCQSSSKHETDDEDDDTNNTLASLRIGSTDWRFEFYHLPSNDPENTIYSFLDALFGDKLCDWKEYVLSHTDDESQGARNNFVTIVKDGHGIWRAAVLFSVYELQLSAGAVKYLVKIPLTGVDLHYRRQNVGTLLIDYTVAMVGHIMRKHQPEQGRQAVEYQLLVLVIDEAQATSFWRKNKFEPAVECTQLVSYADVFEKACMLKNGFVRDIESELILMMYVGEKSEDLVLDNAMARNFKVPKFVNFNQRYCKRDEIEQTERAHKEWEQKKKELEEKQKQKQKQKDVDGDGQDDEDEDESDEDFDFEQALQKQSDEEEEESDYEEEEDGDEEEDEDVNHNHNSNVDHKRQTSQ